VVEEMDYGSRKTLRRILINTFPKQSKHIRTSVLLKWLLICRLAISAVRLRRRGAITLRRGPTITLRRPPVIWLVTTILTGGRTLLVSESTQKSVKV
jgi:hypothetical protein